MSKQSKKPRSSAKRRKFVKQSTLASLALLLGKDFALGYPLPNNVEPLALNSSVDFYSLPEKDERLTILNDRPVNAETPPHLLDDDITPKELLFVRNNGIPPNTIDPDNWTLTIEGEAAQKSVVLSLKELKEKFENISLQLTLECGGNGRKEFNPPAKGNQWSLGAVGCPQWTGVRLRDVLDYVGVKKSAIYVAYYGADTHLSGDPDKVPISRGVPISKAMEPESMIAWQINNSRIPVLNGYPLRLVFGSWPASCSGKWLTKIVIRDKVHDGPKMQGQSYRIPCTPVAPGTKVEDKDMCIIEQMPVKSLITYPKTGATIKLDQKLPIRGHAWAGDPKVTTMEYSIDFGSSWAKCSLSDPVNKHAWQHFTANIKFPTVGYFEVWARATDSNQKSQPIILPGWNPKGYLNNACHRIAIKVV